VHVGLAWLFVGRFGVAGAGMAFFGLYVWHGTLIYVIVRRLSGFSWSAENRRTALLLLPMMATVFVIVNLLPFWLATAAGTVAVLTTGAYSAHMLSRLAPDDRVSRILNKFPWRRGRVSDRSSS
jgi:antigen flippase